LRFATAVIMKTQIPTPGTEANHHILVGGDCPMYTWAISVENADAILPQVSSEMAVCLQLAVAKGKCRTAAPPLTYGVPTGL